MNAADLESVPEIDAAEETDGARLAAVEKSLRRHRVWLAVLTGTIGLFVMSILGMITIVGYGFGSVVNELGPDESVITDAKTEIEDAYGDRLDDVDVRLVKVKYDDTPFPFAVMSSGDMKSLYVEYTLEGSDAVVADVLSDGPFEGDIASSGMLPTKGSLASRMDPDQFDRLLAAYAKETKKPLGAVRRYGVSPYPMESGSSVPDEVTVGSKTYPSKQLWSAGEGRIVEGDEVDMSAQSDFNRKALIFHEDPETGEFTFLGVEPAERLW